MAYSEHDLSERQLPRRTIGQTIYCGENPKQKVNQRIISIIQFYFFEKTFSFLDIIKSSTFRICAG
jgi:hypothetical protein